MRGDRFPGHFPLWAEELNWAAHIQAEPAMSGCAALGWRIGRVGDLICARAGISDAVKLGCLSLLRGRSICIRYKSIEVNPIGLSPEDLHLSVPHG